MVLMCHITHNFYGSTFDPYFNVYFAVVGGVDGVAIVVGGNQNELKHTKSKS